MKWGFLNIPPNSPSPNPVIYDYTFCGTELERVKEYVDLGVAATSNLSWNSHVRNITNTALNVMGLIK